MVKLFAMVMIGLLSANVAQAKMLISEQEAKMPESPFNARSAFPGPKLVLISPDVNATAKSPLRLQVKFETRGAKINLDSLKVTYVKLEPIDLTERVREFATGDGIDFKDAEIPPGTHKIRVEVKDTDGFAGGAVFILKVAK